MRQTRVQKKTYTERDLAEMAAKVYNAAITVVAECAGIPAVRLRWSPKLAFKQTVENALNRRDGGKTNTVPSFKRGPRLSRAQRAQIRKRLRGGDLVADIANDFGVTVATVYYHRHRMR